MTTAEVVSTHTDSRPEPPVIMPDRYTTVSWWWYESLTANPK